MGESIYMARWIRFFLAISVGITLGLAYSWFINPASSTDTALDTLRMDYKTDIVLMVAEAYQVEGDPILAAQRLAMLGKNPPTAQVEESLQFAIKVGYTEPDINRMQTLLNALQATAPIEGSSIQ